MENYTEIMLKKLNKDDLLKIAADNQIEVPNGATNNKIIELILARGCPVPADGGELAKTPEKAEKPCAVPAMDDGLPKFSKEQLLKSATYSHRRDILQALLDDDRKYSHAEVAEILKNFYEKKVN